MQTAEIVMAGKESVIDDRLIEMDYGPYGDGSMDRFKITLTDAAKTEAEH